MDAAPMRVLCVGNGASEPWVGDLLRAEDAPTLTYADRGPRAIELLQKQGFDAVLLDLTSTTTLDLAPLAALIEAAPDTPILVVAARDDQAAVTEVIAAGARDYLVAAELSGRSLVRALWKARAQQTAQGRVAAHLHVSQSQLEETERLAHVGHWSWDLATDQLTWSDEHFHIFGLEPRAGVVSWAERRAFIHPQDLARVEQLMECTIREGGAYETELRIVWPDGTVRIIESRGAAERDASGAPVRMYGTAQDITERKRGEERLRVAQRMEAIGVLASGVAHDFNNVLTVIIGASEELLANLGRRQALRPPLEEITRAAERGAMLTRQLLALSRAEEPELGVLDLNRIVADLERVLHRVIGEDIELATVLAPHLGPVLVDRGQLELVVLNLAANARDAMPGGGKLRITTADVDLTAAAEDSGLAPGPYVSLTVSDSGEGMDAQTAERIFEPFFTTKAEGRGTGLGLVTVHEIVTRSGGAIRVTTEPGRGSTFRIYLPRAVEARQAPPGVEPADEPGGSETVLLVEDDAEVRALTARMLQAAGYQVEEMADARAALERLGARGQSIDLLVTDVVLPGMGGVALAREAVRIRPGIRILFISGYPRTLAIEQGLIAETDLFIRKPFSSRDLRHAVRAALERA